MGAALTVLLSFSVVLGEEATPYPEFVEEVFLTESEAIRLIFPDATDWRKESLSLSPRQVARIERRTGWKLSVEKYDVHVVRGHDGGLAGYAMVVEEVGKFKPITFLVGTTLAFRVKAVEVLVYREPIGREVRRKRFLRQYRKKKPSSPLRINRDIINISGATMSVRAVSAGVKRALCVLEEFYSEKKG